MDEFEVHMGSVYARYIARDVVPLKLLTFIKPLENSDLKMIMEDKKIDVVLEFG